MKKRVSLLYAVIIVLTVFLAWYISVFHYQLMLVHGDSMLPTYRSGSLLVLQKHPDEYARGDVVLCRVEPLGRSIVKRIAAVPGDAVSVIDGELLINGVYAAPLPDVSLRADFLDNGPLVLSPGQYLLLGDNLAHSIDSRFAQVGLVSEEQLRGRVVK
ncbi:MAG: signal peptidase I [Oscillospiraceae bacterium]|nr:signal peptidase I [Oscillospiraceae bacterium]